MLLPLLQQRAVPRATYAPCSVPVPWGHLHALKLALLREEPKQT